MTMTAATSTGRCAVSVRLTIYFADNLSETGADTGFCARRSVVILICCCSVFYDFYVFGNESFTFYYNVPELGTYVGASRGGNVIQCFKLRQCEQFSEDTTVLEDGSIKRSGSAVLCFIAFVRVFRSQSR